MKWLDQLRFGPMTRDRCEVCGTPLRVKQRVEITEVIENTDLGGSAISATYCKQHAPQEART